MTSIRMRWKMTAMATAAAIALTTLQSEACTGIMPKTNDGPIVHGRTVEFGVILLPEFR